MGIWAWAVSLLQRWGERRRDAKLDKMIRDARARGPSVPPCVVRAIGEHATAGVRLWGVYLAACHIATCEGAIEATRQALRTPTSRLPPSTGDVTADMWDAYVAYPRGAVEGKIVEQVVVEFISPYDPFDPGYVVDAYVVQRRFFLGGCEFVTTIDIGD